MSQAIYWIARSDDDAQEVINKIKGTGIVSNALRVITKPDEIAAITRHMSEEARNAANGAVGGTVVGVLFGAAVLSTMGSNGIPGLFEAALLLACAAFGGAMFGAIIGSTGIFAAKRILIAVDIKNAAECDRLIRQMNGLGVRDARYSVEQAA